MKTVLSFAAGFITALTLASIIIDQTTIIETITETETIVEHVQATIDLDRLRDTSATSHHDDQLMSECARAIQRHTDEPLMGIILYIEQHWQGDACAALEHYHVNGWY